MKALLLTGHGGSEKLEYREDVPTPELATFPAAYVTSPRLLNRARVSAGETVLVTGPSGGVGSGLVQLARLRGAQVIALVGAGKEDRARALGAELVITRDAGNLPAAVAKALPCLVDEEAILV